MKGLVSFADFQKLDLRVGRIEKVETPEGLDRLYQLTVDFGLELGQKTVLAGVKDYSVEELIGRKAVFVYNLEPKTVKGYVSEAMLLAACPVSGESELPPIILVPEKDLPEGSLVR